MRRLTLILAVFALTLAASATPALAGGWAVTTFDDMPGQFVSGKEYALGYTIRQHGATPINVGKTEIVAVAVSGRTLSFPGRSDGAVGHYAATVFFPAGGTYTWHVTQGDFAAQDLGKVTVLAAAGTTSDDKKAVADKTAAEKAAADKAGADKALTADKAAALDKAAAAEKAAAFDKAAAAEKAAVDSKAAAAEKAAGNNTITGASPIAATQTSDPLRSALPFAAAAAAAMFIWRLVTMVRTSRRTTA
jgi:hypothetical protein